MVFPKKNSKKRVTIKKIIKIKKDKSQKFLVTNPQIKINSKSNKTKIIKNLKNCKEKTKEFSKKTQNPLSKGETFKKSLFQEDLKKEITNNKEEIIEEIIKTIIILLIKKKWNFKHY